MSQCVPSWDLDDTPNSSRLTLPPNLSTMDYEVAELTWENGQLAMHGLGPPRVDAGKPFSISSSKYTWDKPRATDTLESIVNQVSTFPPPPPPPPQPPQHKVLPFNSDLLPWLDHYHLRASASPAPLAVDALVPSSNPANSVEETSRHVPHPSAKPRSAPAYSTHVASCSGTATDQERERTRGKRARVARVPTTASAGVVSDSTDQSGSGSASATFGEESRHVTVDTCDLEGDAGFGSTSTLGGSLDNTATANPSPSYTKPATVDDHDSVAHSRPQQASLT